MIRFTKWLDAGVMPGMPEEARRRVMLTGRLAVACIAVTFTAIPSDYKAGGTTLVIFDILFGAYFIGVVLSNRTTRQHFTRWAFLIGTNVGVTINLLLLGKMSGVQYLCYPMITVPLAVLLPTQKKTRTLFMLYPIFLFILVDASILDPYLFVKTTATAGQSTYWFSVCASFVMLLIALRHFERVHADDLRHIVDTQAKLTQVANMSAVGQMAAGIAHEMNNPLAIIQFKAEKARRLVGDEPTEVLNSLDRIMEMVVRMSTIVRSLRVVARDSTSEQPVAFSMADAVSTALDLSGDRIRDHGIRLELSLHTNKVQLFARQVQVSQVLINLLSNAFDAVATSADKWVRIETKDCGKSVSISIIDSGPGIPAEKRAQIFAPFYTTKEVGHGTGLGLSISSALAFSNGGSLALDASSPHTRFVLTIPKVATNRNSFREHRSG